MNYRLSQIIGILVILFSLVVFESNAQIQYQNVSNKQLSLGSYGRVGVDWSFDDGASSIGRRLNLNNMGSIGGRMEEQDYFELAPALHFTPTKDEVTKIDVQFRFAVYSESLTSIGNSTTSSLGGLTIAVPELFAQARNIGGSGVNVWIGSRFYRGADVHIADHFYFNDHSGQGFGIEYKDTRFATLFVEATDTTSTVPPYFYLNFKTGTPSTALRQRTVFILEHDFVLNKRKNSKITALGEFHSMPDGGEPTGDDDLDQYNYPSDRGFVIGLRHHSDIHKMKEGSFNDFSVRLGTGIANGGDGGLSRTWLTYGAPNAETRDFKGAYSLALVNHALFNYSKKHSLNWYTILTASKGGSKSSDKAYTFDGKEIYNKKFDFTIGARNQNYITDYLHLLTEIHYSQRQDGKNPLAAMWKFTIAPVLVPTGEHSVWARPHLRFVASFARYNDYAMDSLYSPYLEFTGSKRWGQYFGVKAEWWIW